MFSEEPWVGIAEVAAHLGVAKDDEGRSELEPRLRNLKDRSSLYVADDELLELETTPGVCAGRYSSQSVG